MQTQQQRQRFDKSQREKRKLKRLAYVRWIVAIAALFVFIIGASIWKLIDLGVLRGPLFSVLSTIFVVIAAVFAAFAAFISTINSLLPVFKPFFKSSFRQSELLISSSAPSPSPPQQVVRHTTTPDSTSQQLLYADKSGPRAILGLPPPTHSSTIQQRKRVVQNIYEKLSQPNITATVLTGIGGVGKSTLAALVYHYAEEQRQAGKSPFVDSPVWLTVDGAVTLADLARTLFEALDKPLPDFGHLAPQHQALVLFNLLNTVDKPRLVVLDQFENLLDSQTSSALTDRPGVGEFIDALNSQPCICRVLLTSRLRPKGVREYPPTYMQEYHDRGLEITEGIELLSKQGVKGTETELRIAVKHCDGHGLALKLLVTVLGDYNLSLSTLLKDRTYARLWDGDIATNLLDYIYTNQLNDLQRELLRTFSVYREAVSLEAVEVLVEEATKSQVSSALRVLLTQHLVQTAKEGYYQLHAIVANYARDHFVDHDKDANLQARKAAHAKATRYYLEQAAMICPPREKRRRVSDVHLLVEAVWQECQAGLFKDVYALMQRENLFDDLHRWGGSAILLEIYQLLLTLDKWYPERRQLALIYSNMGLVHNTLGRKAEALEYYKQVLSISRELKDRKRESEALHNLGGVYDDLWEKDKALEYYKQALLIRREIKDRIGEGVTLSNLGRLYDDSGQKELAQEYLERALHIFSEVRNREGEAAVLNNMGRLYISLDQKIQAQRHFEQALLIRRELGDRGGEANTLSNLGLAYSSLGEKKQAQEYYEQALNIYKEIGNRWGEGTALNNIGTLYHDIGWGERALEYYERALSVRSEVRDRGGEGITLNNLALVCFSLGDKERALDYYEQALIIRKALGDREREGTTLYNIGALYFELNLFEVALACFLLARGIFEEIDSPNDEKLQVGIDIMRNQMGAEEFSTLLTKVAPLAHQIVEKALRKGLR